MYEVSGGDTIPVVERSFGTPRSGHQSLMQPPSLSRFLHWQHLCAAAAVPAFGTSKWLSYGEFEAKKSVGY